MSLGEIFCLCFGVVVIHGHVVEMFELDLAEKTWGEEERESQQYERCR